jgi:hypothetical protein
MEQIQNLVIPLIIGILASSGFWAFMEKRTQKKTLQAELLMAIARDRIVRLCTGYLNRGWISQEEYEDVSILYQSYSAMGGNGSAKRIMLQVDKLPTRRDVQLPGRLPTNPDGTTVTGDTIK